MTSHRHIAPSSPSSKITKLSNLSSMTLSSEIETYQLIRLYCLKLYHEQFILYSMKAIGTRDNRGKKAQSTGLQDELGSFYKAEFKDLITNDKFDLKNTKHQVTLSRIDTNNFPLCALGLSSDSWEARLSFRRSLLASSKQLEDAGISQGSLVTCHVTSR